jgi:hypothetical protein
MYRRSERRDSCQRKTSKILWDLAMRVLEYDGHDFGRFCAMDRVHWLWCWISGSYRERKRMHMIYDQRAILVRPNAVQIHTLSMREQITERLQVGEMCSKYRRPGIGAVNGDIHW